ncbi:hypothetical protein CVV65_06025 [Kyrpidia spormannii]|uniref:Peptidase M28 domain-containing protein n=1 Tax=Kyrpidia spormannii TaxID=2055160 RepID=A0A2K8N5D0_9BACL|nr:M28 family peptidase [Kyrpidia spormannii]ATY84559.1 hypothetical protein CVV65_06025 [Kyrpidia spormannii]
MPVRSIDKSERELIAAVDRVRLVEWNRRLVREVRLSGSAEEARAFDEVQAELERLGFTTKRMSTDAYISLPIRASLEVNGEAVDCITHSMSASVQDLQASLVDLAPLPPDRWSADILAGRVGLTDGLAVPGLVVRAMECGAAGMVFVNGDLTYEMIVSPVWGHPTPETLDRLPTIPVVSVTRHGGERIRELMRGGTAECVMTTVVDTGIRPIPVLTAEINGRETPEDFVLFSGHIDSWHYGAMDNASANALMVEVARVVAAHRYELRRSLRLAFWSGHSHGRYAGSAWYCDTHWEELHEHCMVHINVDSVGGRGATVLSEANAMAETKPLAAEVIEALTGQSFVGTRYGRSGDQSFWGPGVPSLFMGLSEQPASDDPAARAFAQLFGGGNTGGFGWWWHTTEDTLDKIDPDLLVRDTQIYLLVIWRFLTDPLLPITCSKAALDVESALMRWQSRAGEHLDLSEAIRRARELTQRLRAIDAQMPDLQDPAARETCNRLIMRMCRLLVPLNYVKGSPFDHDLALSQSPLPKLADIDRLAAEAPGTLRHRALQTALRRRSNEVCHTLKEAIRLADEWSDVLTNARRQEEGASE